MRQIGTQNVYHYALLNNCSMLFLGKDRTGTVQSTLNMCSLWKFLSNWRYAGILGEWCHTQTHTCCRSGLHLAAIFLSTWTPRAEFSSLHLRQRKLCKIGSLLLHLRLKSDKNTPSPPLSQHCLCVQLSGQCRHGGVGGGGQMRGCGFSHTREPTHLVPNRHTLPLFATWRGFASVLTASLPRKATRVSK